MDIDVEDMRAAMMVTWDTPRDPQPVATFISRGVNETDDEPEEDADPTG